MVLREVINRLDSSRQVSYIEWETLTHLASFGVLFKLLFVLLFRFTFVCARLSLYPDNCYDCLLFVRGLEWHGHWDRSLDWYRTMYVIDNNGQSRQRTTNNNSQQVVVYLFRYICLNV